MRFGRRVRARWPLRALAFLLLAVALPATGDGKALTLQDCTLDEVDRPARCGTMEVYEDRDARKGRKIPLFVAVLPATEAPAKPDPLFFLAGGPGQSATVLAGFAAEGLERVGRSRDIVLVDLAGTGRSGALACTFYGEPRDLVGDFYPVERVRACRAAHARRTDLRRYVTSTLADDLDEVRAALGYEAINLYGTSYGSRLALDYVRRHRAHVRTIVLKAVAPTTMRGTMHYARDTERSLRAIFRACAADAGCAAAYPKVEAELREVLRRAERGQLRAEVPDPEGGAAVELPVTRGAVASTLLGLLQNTNSAVRLPALIHAVHAGDTARLVESIAGYRRALDRGIAWGMHLSVLCSEDAPRLDPAAAARDDRDTALRDYRVAQLAAACREWPRGEVPDGFGEPVRSDVPALLVSGALDPNTNERWGEEAVRHLSRGTHVVIPALSHGFSSLRECGAGFIAAFIERASMEGVDVSCRDRVRLPPFATAD